MDSYREIPFAPAARSPPNTRESSHPVTCAVAPTPQGSLDRCTPPALVRSPVLFTKQPLSFPSFAGAAFQTEASPRANSESGRITACRIPKTPSPRSNSPPIAPMPPSPPAPVPRKARPAPPRTPANTNSPPPVTPSSASKTSRKSPTSRTTSWPSTSPSTPRNSSPSSASPSPSRPSSAPRASNPASSPPASTKPSDSGDNPVVMMNPDLAAGDIEITRAQNRNYRPPDPEEKDLIPITAEWRGNSDFTLVPAG